MSRINNKFIIVTLILIICTLIIFYRTKTEDSNIFIDLPSYPKTLDPQINDSFDSKMIIKNLFDGLVEIIDDKPILNLATNHTIDNDGKKHIFTIKNNIYWSDKNKSLVTSHDFVFSFKRILNENTNSPFLKKYQFIDKIYAIDDYTLVFELKHEVNDFLSLLANPETMPCNENFFNSTNGSYGVGINNLISNSYFSLSSTDEQTYISLQKNKNYNGEKNKNIDFVKFLVKKDNLERIERFKKGYTQALILDKYDENIIKNNNIIPFSNNIISLLLNQNNFFLKNENIRKALISSINLEELKQHFNENITKINSLFPKNIFFLETEIENLNTYNIIEAKKSILNGIKELSINKISNLNILISEDFKYKNLISSITQVWQRDLGVFVNIKEVDKNEFLKIIKTNDFDLAISNYNNLSLSLSESIYSFFSYNNINITPEINSLIYNIDNKKETEKIKILNNIQEIIKNQNLILNLFSENKYFVTSKKYKFLKYNYRYNFINLKNT